MKHNIMLQKEDKTIFQQNFFAEIEPIKLIDPLAETLGVVAANNEIYYYYQEIVKFAGHSCLAVSGAFMMCKIALKKLYKNETPIRGEIRVNFKGDEELNVNGPISQVVSFITGAAPNTGFKGLGGKFSRYKLLSFSKNDKPQEGITAEIDFERIDNGKKVSIAYRPNLVKKDPLMGKLLELILRGKASTEEKIMFGNLWQSGVKEVLTNAPDGVFVVNEEKK